MSRDLPSTLQAACAASGSVGTFALLVEMRFDSGVVGMWTGLGDLVYNGITFTGGGNLVSCSTYEETEDLEAKGMVFTLSGVPLNLIEIALDEPYQGRPIRMYIAMVDITPAIALEDESGIILTEGGDRILLESQVQEAYRLFSGMMNTMNIVEDGDTATIHLTAENVLILLKRTKERRYTDFDQRSRYPDDEGLKFISQLQDKPLTW